MALQTREQHIRREKATSNICTAMALLANVSAMYAVYHGPKGLRQIADRVHSLALVLQSALQQHMTNGQVFSGAIFDTVSVTGLTNVQALADACEARGYNIRVVDASTIAISVDETTLDTDIQSIVEALTGKTVQPQQVFADAKVGSRMQYATPALDRTSAYLTHPVFNSFHTEHDLLRYMYKLQLKDISLANSMIPLGSCTMKLNATVELMPITWPEFANIHPYAPASQTKGYAKLFQNLRDWLGEITGFPGISLQPISGASGEYAGLMVIRQYFASRNEVQKRKLCLIPTSAHGTNPASAVLAGFTVVPVACDSQGNVDLADVQAKVKEHGDKIACIMMTYPSTHGIFEEDVKKICDVVHSVGAQVYMDGANMNAQVGLCSPGAIGADVCHLNLHKTFAIPHGGGGPPAAPIGVAKHLVPFLPGNPLQNGREGLGAVSGTDVAVPAILPISWTYINCMGASGLRKATSVAILNANYMARRLEGHYPLVYRGKNGFVAHEFIIDIRPFKATAGIEAEDIAKRLMDYGFHAPTMSFPIAGTLMIEPTESEPKAELDRFCDAMIEIRKEIAEIEAGNMDKKNNVLKNAPHTAADLADDAAWNRPYSRDRAVFPLPYLRASKYWPTVNRIDNVYGDRAFRCSCPDWSVYTSAGKQ
jgi:glycine dehydrogenase